MIGALVFVAVNAYRPFDSTDAAVAERGAFELEEGPVGFVSEGGDRFSVYGATVANFGIADRLELVLEGRTVHAATAPRFHAEDAGAFVKWVAREGTLQGAKGPSVAVEVGPRIPTTRDEPYVGVSANVIVSHKWDWAVAHLNVTGGTSRHGRSDAFVGLILEGPWSWTARPVAELSFARETNGPSEKFALLGSIWRATEDLSVDAAVRVGRIDDEPVAEARVGFTLAVPLF